MNRKMMALPLALSVMFTTVAQAGDEFFITSSGQSRVPGVLSDWSQRLGDPITVTADGHADTFHANCVIGSLKTEKVMSQRYVMKISGSGSYIDVRLMAMGVFEKQSLENSTIRTELRRKKPVDFDRYCRTSYIQTITRGGVMHLSLQARQTGPDSITNGSIIVNSIDEANEKMNPVLETIRKNYHVSGTGFGISDPRDTGTVFKNLPPITFSIDSMGAYVQDLLKAAPIETNRYQTLSVIAERNPARPVRKPLTSSWK